MQSVMVRLRCDARSRAASAGTPNPWKTPARCWAGSASCCSQKSSPACGACQVLARSCPSNPVVSDAGGIGDPGPDQLGPGRDHPDHEPAAPVMPDQVDRVVQALELCNK